MVEAHEIKHGGVEIVNVYGVFGDVIAKIIGLAIHAWLDPAAGHPDGETAGMMVAAIVIRAELSLAIVGTAEFAAPDHEGLVEQSALFEIGDKGCRCLVGVFTLASDLHGQVTVSIPALVIQLYEADAAFRKLSREETIGGKCARHQAIGAI